MADFGNVNTGIELLPCGMPEELRERTLTEVNEESEKVVTKR